MIAGAGHGDVTPLRDNRGVEYLSGVCEWAPVYARRISFLLAPPASA
jgi:hypothetical protein